MWKINLYVGDLGAASLHAKLPYMGSENSYVGSYKECRIMAGFIRWLFITQNGYNPIFIKRVNKGMQYRVKAHFGMPEYLLLELNKVGAK